jgi:pyrrolidone-carboxylate peptidase
MSARTVAPSPARADAAALVAATVDSRGAALPARTRATMATRFGRDFAGVRVHVGPPAERSAEALSATAFTFGQHVVLGRGAGRPGTERGDRVLAHELAHVVQQENATGGDPAVGPEPARAEAEARDAAAAPGRVRVRASLGRRCVQRQPAPCDVRHPESCATYEEWIASFGTLPTFTARDTAPAGTHPSNFQVLGADPRPTPGAAPGAPAPAIRPQLADRFIDHPTDAWVQANLPPELRLVAYRLPADCADVVVVLRHVWVFAQGRSENFRGWRIGLAAGRTEDQRARSLTHLMVMEVGSFNVARLALPYSSPTGGPERSFAGLEPLLHPGDVLVWEHRAGTQTGRRTGGHSQTIERIDRDPSTGAIARMTLLQGNQPIFGAQAEEIAPGRGRTQRRLRDAPGRRIERATLTARGVDENGIWTEREVADDGTVEVTVLIAAGPVSAARRSGRGAATLGRTGDWLAALRRAGSDDLEPVLEAALHAARAQLEAAPPGQPGLSTADARLLGQTAGERLWALHTQRRGDLGEGHFRALARARATIQAFARSDRVAPARIPAGGATPPPRRADLLAERVASTFAEMEDAFELAARGATTAVFPGPRRDRRQVNVLLTGFDPFFGDVTTGDVYPPPRAGEWNPAGAAVMALDGTSVPLERGAAAEVQGVVLPVSYAEFGGSDRFGSIVERAVGPASRSADAAITVSMDAGRDPGYKDPRPPLRIEQHAVGVHWVQSMQPAPELPVEPAIPGLEPVPTAREPGGGRGPAAAPILSSPEAADVVSAWPARGAGPAPDLGGDVLLGFASDATARAAITALGLPASTPLEAAVATAPGQAPARFVSGVRVRGAAVAQVLATMRPLTGTTIRFTASGRDFDATVVEGPGGSFLSNEVSYRVRRLLGAQGRSAPSFHVHTPAGGVATGANRRATRGRLAQVVDALRTTIRILGGIVLRRRTPTGRP